MTEPQTAEDWRRGLDLDPQEAIEAGKRLGVQWSPWMGDWFTSWSPRNDNSYAEGPWEQWVDLALRILNDPLTKAVRPDIVAPDVPLREDWYSAVRLLTDAELQVRFGVEVQR